MKRSNTFQFYGGPKDGEILFLKEPKVIPVIPMYIPLERKPPWMVIPLDTGKGEVFIYEPYALEAIG